MYVVEVLDQVIDKEEEANLSGKKKFPAKAHRRKEELNCFLCACAPLREKFFYSVASLLMTASACASSARVKLACELKSAPFLASNPRERATET